MSLTMTLDTSGRYPRFVWRQAAEVWARGAAPLGENMLRARAPFRTGALRQDIHSRTEIAEGLATILFYTQVSYAKYILGGTGPHVIAAVNARALRWITANGNGQARFARQVRHPGTKPNPFPEDAMKTIEPGVAHLFAEAVRESMIQ